MLKSNHSWVGTVISMVGGTALLMACGSSGKAELGPSGGESDAQAATPADAGTQADAETADASKVDVAPPPTGEDCADKGKFVYLFTNTGALHSFDPASKATTLLGQLSCGTKAKANSMAVARNGQAYVNYADGSIYTVDLKTLACSKTSFSESGWAQLGMGFTGDGTPTGETLFISKVTKDGSSSELAQVALPSMQVTKMGPFPSTVMGQSPELTGTADGALFGFFNRQETNAPGVLARVDKATAAISDEVSLAAVTNLTAFAVTAWGGDFYVYYAQGSANSKVGRYRPSDKSFTEYATLKFRVFGAGASTCSPTTQPKSE